MRIICSNILFILSILQKKEDLVNSFSFSGLVHAPLSSSSTYVRILSYHISLEKSCTLDKISSEEHRSLEIWDSPLFLSSVYQSKNHMIPNPGK